MNTKSLLVILMISVFSFCITTLPSYAHEHYIITLTNLSHNMVEIHNTSKYDYIIANPNLAEGSMHMHNVVSLIVSFYDKDGDDIGDVPLCRWSANVKAGQVQRFSFDVPSNAVSRTYSFTTYTHSDACRYLHLEILNKSNNEAPVHDSAYDNYQMNMNRMNNGLPPAQ